MNSIVDLVDFSGSTIQTIVNVVQNSSFHSLPKGSGTTLAGLVAKNNKVIVFNAGDSRVYKLTRDGITCVSRDHSLVQDLVEKGMITDEEAFNHPYRNVVNFGIGPAFIRARTKYEVYTHEEEMSPDACYLICSDGVSDIIRNHEILSVLGKKPVEDAQKLVEALNKLKLKDNTSFIVAEIKTA